MSVVPEYLNRRRALKTLIGGVLGTFAASKLVHANSKIASSDS